MSSRSTIPSPVHNPGDELHGFAIEKVTEIPDIRALAYEATHKKTGAQVLHVHCYDEENMFSVGFRTPPEDSTGVAHILEHCVLAGSQKYPVKDAFNELGKRTLNTFLNAMTWPDRTVYPVCSAVKADYFNLASVYSDLVFHPLLKRQTFEREGHHLELSEPDKGAESGLTISGVVYNEMKGVYSNPDNYVMRGLQQHLSPDTPYGVDSGGDPAVIPDLTYQQFTDFHRQYYSPSNARFLLYGDISLEENLAFIEGVLGPFDRIEVDSDLPDQAFWDAPREASFAYPVSEEDSLERKTFTMLAWLVGSSADIDEVLMFDVISFALYGSAAGPLRKALIDSGLGQDIFPRGGFDSTLRQSTMNFGLRGTDPEHAEAIEALILKTLHDVAEEGLDPELIEASMHQIAFDGAEIVPPFPLMVLYRTNPAWYYDGDPKDGLQFGSAVKRLRARYADNPQLFNEAIREKLIHNTHRLRLVAQPSQTLFKEWEEAFVERMTSQRAGMADAEVQAVADNVAALQEDQNTPDSPEALAALPSLALEEIPREVRTIPTESGQLGGRPFFAHPVFSNGVAYVALDFDVSDLSDDETLLLPLLGRATLGMGAAGLNYEGVARRIARYTGGIGSQTLAGRHMGEDAHYERWAIDGKALAHNIPQYFEILGDLLTSPDTSDHKRLRDLVQEMATRSESRVIPAGHRFAYTRAAASLDHALWRHEQWGGVTQIQHLKSLTAKGDDIPALAATLAALQKRLLTRQRVSVRVAGDPELIGPLREHAERLLQKLPAGSPVEARTPSAPNIASDVGIVIAGQVNYVGQVLKVPNMRHEDAAAFEMLASILSNDILYQKLRVQGGAYGGFAFYTGDSGLIPLVSYRDPNLLETFEVYRDLPAHLAALGVTDETVESSRIGAIGSHSRVLSPSQQLQAARGRHLKGITDEDRARFRAGLFEVGAADLLQKVAPVLEAAIEGSPRAALGGRERLNEASAALGGGFDIISL